MNNYFYNSYHKKNISIQTKVIDRNNFTYRTIIKLIDKYLGNIANLFDVGCGVGTIDFYLASKVNSIVGIDISNRAIGLAKKSAKELGINNITYICHDLLRYVFPKSKFDAVICSEVIEHIKDDRKLVRNLFKCLKTDGLLIISTPSKRAPLFRMGLLSEFDSKVGHLRRYNADELSYLLKKNGFKIEEIIYTEGILRNFIFTNDNFGWVVRLLKYPLSSVFNYVDDFSLRLLGESNIYMVCKKL